MTRVSTLFLTVLPSMIAGGFLFASAFGHAETGRDGALGQWPAASETATGRVLVAQADPWSPPRTRRTPVPPAPPAPPAPHAAPVPPMPPTPPTHRGRRGHNGVSVSFHDGKIQLDGLADMVEGQLEGITGMLDGMTDVSPEVRDRVRARVNAVRATVHTRLGKLKTMDLDKIGPEMERMGDEIEREMAGLDKDLAGLGDRLGKHFAKQLGKDLAKRLESSQPDADSDADNNDADDEDDDSDEDDRDAVVMPQGDHDFDPASLPQIADLKNLTLEPSQKAELARLRADADRQVAAAKRSLDEMSDRLHEALDEGRATEADIARQIDSISAQEAIIRKARILTWVKARNVLHKEQRRMVESAAKTR